MDIYMIQINKNRGWRGLAEVCGYNKEGDRVTKMLFSFSQPVWDDMLLGYMVIQDPENYMVLQFDNIDKLPSGQRSVLLKNFTAHVTDIEVYPKERWSQLALAKGQYNIISHFIKNRNNHTTSDWNCIGIRVVPEI